MVYNYADHVVADGTSAMGTTGWLHAEQPAMPEHHRLHHIMPPSIQPSAL
jgi:hypothetical protein